ncbi:hypothetical protein ES705_42681 [subsurface metagenome]
MALSERETQSLIEKAWRGRARGRPMRWRILRDMVAVLSLEWMNTSQVQMAMRRLWALKNNTTRDILEELESEGAIIQERDDKTQIFKWGATREGVKFWILGTENIPAGVVQVVSTTSFVAKLEVGTSP